MQLNGTARQLIWQLCLYSLITASNSLNKAFVCRVSRILCAPSWTLPCPMGLLSTYWPSCFQRRLSCGTLRASVVGGFWERKLYDMWRISSSAIWHCMLQLLIAANVVPNSLIIFSMKLATIRSSSTSVLTRATRRHIPEDNILHSHRREHFRPCMYDLYSQISYHINVIPLYIPLRIILSCQLFLFKNSVALSPQANYTDWATATCRRNVAWSAQWIPYGR
jgi:hypothetical protein